MLNNDHKVVILLLLDPKIAVCSIYAWENVSSQVEL